MMRSSKYLAIALLLGVAACDTLTPVDPGVEPPATSMEFTKGARYQYESYSTDASTNQRTDSTSRTRTWTLLNVTASAYGKTNVAVFIDSVFNTGGFVNVSDSIYLQQATNNDVYRYASLVPELDVSGVALLDIGREWMHEAKLNATSANWFVADVADTIPNTFGLPLVNGIKLSVTDSAVASVIEDMTIGTQTYKTTKTTHHLVFKVTVLAVLPVVVDTRSITRTTWMAPTLGTIVREERQGVVISATYQGQGFTIPVPGYHSELKAVLATGK